jgi:hypothetical protein
LRYEQPGGDVAQTKTTIIGALLLASSLAACSTVSGNRVPAGKVPAATAYQLTMSANSADFRLVFAFTSPDQGASATTTASGSYSWAASEGAFTVQGTVPGAYAITSQEVVDGNETYSRIISKSGPLSFLIAPAFGGSSGHGWTESKISGGTVASVLDLFTQGLESVQARPFEQPSSDNPANLLAVLQSVSGAVADLGKQAVGGVPATHYRTTVPFTRLGSGSEAAKAAAELGSTGLTVDYWIDSDGRLRQLKMAVTIITSGPPREAISVTLQLSNYGTRAQVSVPPPREVTFRQSCKFSASGFTCTSTT